MQLLLGLFVYMTAIYTGATSFAAFITNLLMAATGCLRKTPARIKQVRTDFYLACHAQTVLPARACVILLHPASSGGCGDVRSASPIVILLSLLLNVSGRIPVRYELFRTRRPMHGLCQGYNR